LELRDQPPWAERDNRVCWHPYTQHALAGELLPVVGARGAWLELEDGRRMLDAISSWWACLHGHGEPRLVDAMARQAARLDHVLFAGCTHPGAVALAERLAVLSPPGLSRVFYSDDGSTAVEVALKACYAAGRRRREGARTTFVALEGGYHGDTFGAMAVGDPNPFHTAYGDLLFDVQRVPADAGVLAARMDALGDRVAALILEPIVRGAAGMAAVAPDVLRAARAACTRNGAFLIADEVMTGFGRTGTLFACEQADIAPDALCAAKGLTGGMVPLAATLFTEEIYESFWDERADRMFFHGHTFTAYAIGCAVALASLAIIEEEGTPGRLDVIGARIADTLTEAGLPPDVELRRFGGIVATEVGGEAGYLSEVGTRLKAACRTRSPDVLLRPLGNVLYAMPPACTSPEECTLVAQRMADVLHAVG
jgi:adenosylmethionine-8-amino-7-oxononanoate aminotransferase